jgi:lariat debranching enzyme
MLLFSLFSLAETTKQAIISLNCTPPPFAVLTRFYGGWVAPNIYYLGKSGVVNFCGITIGGLSGIYKRYHYHQGNYERLPYTEDTKRSIYHIREFDVQKLSFIDTPTVFLSHDWPTGIHRYGDYQALLAKKPHFREDIQRGELGSAPAEMLLGKLRPQYWFSAHLHVKFAAFVDHNVVPTTEDNEGEIVLEDSENDMSESTRQLSPSKRPPPPSTESSAKRPHRETNTSSDKQVTRFLALDKCLPHRDFLQLLDIESDSNVPYSKSLSYQPQWLAITKSFHPYLSTTVTPKPLPLDAELHSYSKAD